MTTTSAGSRAVPLGGQMRRISVRFRLLIGGVVALVLALAGIAQTVRAYDQTYERFRSIAEDSTAKVDAAEAALQDVANIDTQAAIFVATAPDNPIHWSSQDQIHASYQQFREQMYLIRARLTNPAEVDNPNTTDPEAASYKQIEYFSFDQFWQHIGNLLTAQQSGDTQTATQEYIIADNYLQNQIVRYLLQLEALNFQAMQTTQQGAAAAINSQTVLFAIGAIALAVLLTVLVLWLSRIIRRYFTPGLDVAMVLSWIIAIMVLVELVQAPGLLSRMVDDAYYSVSASSRVLAVANQANSAQSGEVIDSAHAAFWQQTFDADSTSIALRLCGQANCLASPFSGGGDTIDSPVVLSATSISQANSATIGGIEPLVAKVNFSGEAMTLEQARQAWNDYVGIDNNIRCLIKANNLDDAARIANGSVNGAAGTMGLPNGQCNIQAGQSADPFSSDAFKRFTDAITKERDINRQVFNNIWQQEQNDLPLHRALFGIVGYVVVIIALAFGVYHRFREL